MITPHRYLNLDNSVINISYLILDELKQNNILTYDELQSRVDARLKIDASELFIYSLDFLYILRKIKYHGGSLDAFEIDETQ